MSIRLDLWSPSAATDAASSRADFVDGLNVLLLISGLLAIAGGVAALALIRRKDFVVHTEGPPAAGAGSGDGAATRESEPAAA